VRDGKVVLSFHVPPKGEICPIPRPLRGASGSMLTRSEGPLPGRPQPQGPPRPSVQPAGGGVQNPDYGGASHHQADCGPHAIGDRRDALQPLATAACEEPQVEVRADK
jgi:hypothetical protein